MHTTERRKDEERLEIGRSLEILGQEGRTVTVGYTRNLSVGGARARLEALPDAGDRSIKVMLSLEEQAAPVERRAKVVWAAPDIYGDGAEVGLCFVDDEPEVAAGQDTPTPDGDSIPGLLAGDEVEIAAGPVRFAAMVSRCQLLGPGAAEVVLRVALPDAAGPSPDEEEEPIDAEDWAPHPFRDAWRTVRPYVAPVLAVLAQAAIFAGRLLTTAARAGWSRMPAAPRDRLQRFRKRVDLRGRLLAARRRVTTLAAVIAERVRGWRAAHGGNPGD